MRKRILILCPYPFGTAPGQRFRFEQYLDMMQSAGMEVTQQAFLDTKTWRILYQPGHYLQKVSGVLRGFLRRFAMVFRARRFDYIFIYREASPLGPPVIEALLFLLGCKVVYDFDDAIFISQNPHPSVIEKLMKWTSKVAFTTRHSFKVVVSNPYLLNWASQHNRNVIRIPTTIDPNYHRPQIRAEHLPDLVIGWTGSHSTVGYLDLVRPVLKELQEKYDFEFQVICNIDPGFPELRRYKFVKWRLPTEIQDLSAFDVGLMPLTAGTWSSGKAGFKAMQYSAMEIVPVVSSVGSGGEVVIDGKTGFLVDNQPEAWFAVLQMLLEKPSIRTELGKAARQHILQNYSVPSQAAKYIGLFQ